MSDMSVAYTDRDDSLTHLFLSDLPSMAGIVTVVSQPFAQDSLREIARLPDWLPVVVALGVSGLLAIYKILIVRRSGARECAICVPIMMLVVFATYATGNNVVYYAKEGFTRPMSTEQVVALKRERDILEEQLRNAEQAVATLRRALNLPVAPDARPSSAVPETSPWARLFGVGVAEAQSRGDRGRSSRPLAIDRDRSADRGRSVDRDRSGDHDRPVDRDRAVDRDRLKEQLRKFDMEQRELEAKRQSVKPDISPREQQQQPLIKSW